MIREKMISKLKRFDLVLITLVYLAFIPLVGVSKLTDFINFSIFVLAYDLLYGHIGRLSFGHMLYLGTGAYAATLFSVHISTNPLLALVFAICAGVMLGSILGPIIVRKSGAYFALINYAFNSLGHFLALTALANFTGGEDGMGANFSSFGFLNFCDPSIRFAFSMFCLLAVFYLMKRFSSSPYGILLKSIKENETRVKFLGYNVFIFKWVTFILSTSLSAFAGGLWALNFFYVSPSFIDPSRSVEVIFAALIGGAGNPYGAILGGTVYIAMSNYLATYIPRWEMFLGITLLILIFRFPKGISGYFAYHYEKMRGDKQ